MVSVHAQHAGERMHSAAAAPRPTWLGLRAGHLTASLAAFLVASLAASLARHPTSHHGDVRSRLPAAGPSHVTRLATRSGRQSPLPQAQGARTPELLPPLESEQQLHQQSVHGLITAGRVLRILDGPPQRRVVLGQVDQHP